MISVFLVAIGVFLVTLLFGFAVSVVAAIPFWLLWNWVCPVAFGAPPPDLLARLGSSPAGLHHRLDGQVEHHGQELLVVDSRGPSS